MTDDVFHTCDKTIRRLAARLTRAAPGFVEDVASVLWVRLLKAARSFNPARRCSLATYAKRYGRQEAIRFLDSEYRRGTWVPTNRRSEIPRPASRAVTENDPAPIQADRELFWHVVESALTPRQWEVVELCCRQGLTQEEAGAARGWSRQYCGQVLAESLLRLREKVPELRWLL